MARIRGTALEDILPGTEGDDNITSFAGDDDIEGNGGNDTVDGGDGNDIIATEDGNDYIVDSLGDDEASTGGGADEVFGGDGNDILLAGDDNDVVFGELGDDTTDEVGDDFIDGEGGDDVLLGDVGIDTVIGGLGSDFISGGEGGDVLYSHGTRKTGRLLERDEFWGGDDDAEADQFNLLTNYTGGIRGTRPKPTFDSTLPGRDNSFALIRDFSLENGDTLGLLNAPGRYIINDRASYFGRGVADTVILQGSNVVAVVVDATLTRDDLIQAQVIA